MPQRTFITSIDLGTSATTASHTIVSDSLTPDGKLHRDKGRVNVSNIRDWPGGNNGDATGNVCVPTDLIYSRADRSLLLWGFRAKQYLDDPFPDIHPDSVFVVEHIKLLLLDPDNAATSTPASRRYRELRDTLTATLGKQPEDVFEDFLNELIAHIIESANRKYFNGISSFKVELVLAFPSGWPDYLHTKVAGIGARAMTRAIAANKLQNMVFGIENVYTVSETLCGVKEWLRDTIAEVTTSMDLDIQGTNLDELNEGDCFLPVDIGGGTGCMTPLRLVTKDPLRVDQLGPTHSLEVSGEAVEAEFEAWLRPQITSLDYPDDIPRLLYQICRRFKEEKKDCGLPPRPGSTTWNVPIPRMQANPEKGFGKGHMKIQWSSIEKCFDPVIDLLEKAIAQVLATVEGIKTIIFLGQFGSSSAYLRKRMANSHLSELVKLYHSDSGKLNVVRGAMSERLVLNEGFVRKSKTLKSYGALITLPYYPGSEGALWFPDARKLGAVPLERDSDGYRLKVVEWAIPQGMLLENGQLCDTGDEGQRHHALHHTWPRSEETIQFEDMIVVSDEQPPAPRPDGKSYTLWTVAHEENKLIVDDRKMHVQKIPFSWNLAMSKKLDADGNDLGPYDREDLESYMFPEEFRKGRRRTKLLRLHYELIWNITEMQVKLEVRPLFPNPPGPLTIQLAKERPLEAHETGYAGESRSKALSKDIEVSKVAVSKTRERAPPHNKGNDTHSSEQDRNQQQSPTVSPGTTSTPRIVFNLGPRDTNRPVDGADPSTVKPVQGSVSKSADANSAQPDGCFTCKLLRKKCNRTYAFTRTRRDVACRACIRQKIECYIARPAWDDAQIKAKQRELEEQVRSKKRKAREEKQAISAAPTSINPAELHQRTAPVAFMGQTEPRFDDASTDGLGLSCSPPAEQQVIVL